MIILGNKSVGLQGVSVMATPVEAAFWTFSGNLEILDKDANLLIAERQQRVEKLMRRSVTLARTAIIGSYHRNTIIRPLNEGNVDLLVLLDFGKYKRWLTPEGVDRIQEKFAAGLSGRGKADQMPVGRHSLHLQMPEFRLDVMPAVSSTSKGFMVPDFTRRTWVNMHPPAFDRQVSDLDEQQRGRVVPFIRMLKAWNRQAGSPLGGFHLECLVVRFVSEGWPVQDYARAVGDFFRWLQTAVNRPTYEPILGEVIDAYLDEGDVWTNRRRHVIAVVADTSRLIDEATARSANQEWNTALDKWQSILGPYFPAR
jgi:hypothetical protein